ncbi:MAG: pilus assembly protein PilZ [Geobacter sp.]|nr:pilus assembly protein PilZ [Geobacter sp.]
MDKLHIVPRRISLDVLEASAIQLIKPEKTKIIPKRYLVNKLNYLNFQDRTILVNLVHKKYGSILAISAIPLPCAGERLDCVWNDFTDPWILKSHTFQNLFVTDGKKCLLVDPELISIDEKGISLILPETCSESFSRKTKRQVCEGIQAHFTQSSAIFRGTLLDCSPVSFRIQVAAPTAHAFQWINSISTVNLQLHSSHEFLYSGECKIIRQTLEHNSGIFVLSPVHDRIQRYKPKQFRSTRYALIPTPNAIFVHPLTGRTISLKTIDLSGSGFSVEEGVANSMLFAGMIIPELQLNFAQSFKINCRAQVIYRNSSINNEKDGFVKCGLTIMDMAMEDHVKLSSLLHQVDNKNSYVCTSVDMDALWDFFFETGFIYPEKYAFFQTNKLEVKRLYEQLYNHNPGIARHFIHQEKGTILGHISMVRCYENSWLIHHHAASKKESLKAGIMVLKQVSCYANDLHHLQSAHLKYLFSYYRPDNKFPNRVFGGFANEIDDPKGMSLDKFAYFHYRKADVNHELLGGAWSLTATRPEDIEELKRFYDHVSGGLMIDAFDLQPGIFSQDELTAEYQRMGFKKKKHLYSLLEGGELKALILANITDIGLNMTNLTNCVSVIIIDETIPRLFIDSALSKAAEGYEHLEMPVLMYPVSYAERESILIEKIYTLCILNLDYLDQYFKFCDRFFSAV